ncbi:unnamed protein product [Darwinula stevensoni]|uniref:Uncharacterized protein n=1 Tax=Darwinula stevensoni TaxID=69355 RepID=A0A7R8XBE1_9CRUS|nr:unnamed protein product [Darwinula stevensoni]CAG0891156.1 unnamed protein product [Darwinula stevensoni]
MVASGENKIVLVTEEEFTCERFPGFAKENDWIEEGDEEDVKKILGSWLTGIFGYPASGKSRKVDRLIKRVVELRGGVILFLCGSEIFNELIRRRWESQATVEIVPFHEVVMGIESLHDIVESIIVSLRGYLMRIQKEDLVGPVVAVVEDCSLGKWKFADIDTVVKTLKANNLKLIISFKSHSVHAHGISVEGVINSLEKNEDSTAIVIRSHPTDYHILRRIIQRENSWFSEVKNFCKSSEAVVGPPVLYLNYTCSGTHCGCICFGKERCGNSSLVQKSLVQSILAKMTEEDKPQVLVMDDSLVRELRESVRDIRQNIQISHYKDFGGFEASVVISINGNLRDTHDVISRCRTRLIIIDNLLANESIWKALTEAELIQTMDVSFPMDIQDNSDTHMKLKQFLDFVSWNEGGKRIGKEMLRRGLMDEDTGAFLNLPPKLWKALNEYEPFPASFPFTDWGFCSERSFSELKGLKNWIKTTTTTQQRLTNVALMDAHQDVLDSLESD